MSKMQELYKKVAGDITLQEQFNQIVAEAESAGQGATEERLLTFAREAGHEVGLEEMQAFFQGMVTQAEGELSDTELDQVAGGKSTVGGFRIAASVLIPLYCGVASVVTEILERGLCGKAFE